MQGIGKHGVVLLLGAAVCLLGGAIRVWDLRDQSIWFDEHISYVHLDAPSLASCIREQREKNWEMVPVYYVGEYYWAKLVGKDALRVRWLSVFFGVAAIAVLFALGEHLGGVAAGFWAALCMAASSEQVFHAQGIRPYALMVLLGVLSSYSFVRMLEGGGRGWWWATFVLNALLWWTHLFGALLFIPQLLAMIWAKSGRRKGAALWVGGHAAVVLPLLYWISTMQFVPKLDSPRPRWIDFITYPFASDGYLLDIVLKPTQFLELDRLPEVIRAMIQFWPKAQEILALLLVAGVIAALRRICFPITVAQQNSNDARCLAAYPLAWMIFPGFALYLIALLREPEIFQIRYMLFCLPAVYLMLGLWLAERGQRLLRGAAGIALLTALSCQGILSATIMVRPEYRAVGRYLTENGAGKDAVLLCDPYECDFIRFNTPDLPLATPHVSDLGDLALQADEAVAEGKRVFAVLANDGFRLPQEMAKFEEYLSRRNIEYAKTLFPAEKQILAYDCARAATYTPPRAPESLENWRGLVEAHPEEGAWRREWIQALCENGRFDEAGMLCKAALNQAPKDGSLLALLGEVLEKAGKPEEAAQYYEEAIIAAPWDVTPFNRLDALLGANGDPEARVRTWQSVSEKNPDASRAYFLLGEALRGAGRNAEAVAALTRAAEKNPGDPAMQTNLGLALLESGESAAALAPLREALKLNPGIPEARNALIAALSQQGECESAAAERAQCRARNIEVRPEVLELLRGRCPGAAE